MYNLLSAIVLSKIGFSGFVDWNVASLVPLSNEQRQAQKETNDRLKQPNRPSEELHHGNPDATTGFTADAW
jgi:hypothetical protein